MSYTPPPDSEPAVNVLSNLARGRFSRQSRPLAAGTESSAECSALSTVYPTSPHSSDFSYKASPDAQASDDEALALSPELALRVDILGRLPVEISIYCLLFADPIDVLSARLVCRHISAIASDNLVWRDFFHRNPAWRVRPDLLKSVEDAQAAAAIAPLSLDAEAETEEDPHLATPTKPSRHQPQQGARKKLKQGPLSSSYTPRKSNKKLTTADLLGLDTEFGSLSIGEHSTPRSSQQQKTTQSQRQTLPAHAAAFATPVRQPAPSPVSETGRSSVFPTIKSVPSPYFIRPLVAPLNGLNWLDLYARRNELDRRWRMGKSHTSVLRGHKDNIYCVASDSDWIITGSRDPSIK